MNDDIRRLLEKILALLESLSSEIRDLKKQLSKETEAKEKRIIDLSHDFSHRIVEIVNRELSKVFSQIGKTFDDIFEKRVIIYPFSKKGPIIIRLSTFLQDIFSKKDSFTDIDEVIREAEEKIEKSITSEHATREDFIELIKQIDPSELADTLSVLSNPERIRILLLLIEQDRYFSEFEDLMRIGPSSLRHHLSKLLAAGLIQQERSRGKYSITTRGIAALLLLAYLYKKILRGGLSEND
ncbi:MAG: ArsR/SmtB family transcription factor [Candidatus Njordarchaeales archaeon]